RRGRSLQTHESISNMSETVRSPRIGEIHAIRVTLGAGSNPGIPWRIRYLVHYLPCAQPGQLCGSFALASPTTATWREPSWSLADVTIDWRRHYLTQANP